LTWINYRRRELPDEASVTSRRRPKIRHCPLCGIAMQAAKSRESMAEFDIFRCLTCQTTITETKPQPPRGQTEA
jgi:hypothetical protein